MPDCYGWSLCGGLHSEQSALWRQLGWGWRFVGWNGHTTVEANYDGQWHYLDVFLKFYAWKPDPNSPCGRTIAGEDELTNNSEELIRNAFVMDQARKCVYAKNNQFGRYGDQVYWLAPAMLSCGDELEGVIGGLKTHHRSGSDEGWAGIVHDDRGYSADVDLAPGFALTNTWDAVPDAWYWGNSKNPPAHTCGGHKDTRNDPGIGLVLEPYVQGKSSRNYANGMLTFTADFSNAAVLNSFVAIENVKCGNESLLPAESGKPGVVVVDFASPYLLTKASGEAFQHQFVKWLKDDSDAWVMLVDFGADKLPKLDDLASAKLVLYVAEANDRAPMQVAAVILDSPFESGQPYDFTKLGQKVGSTIVRQGSGGPISPPQRYEIDVTRAVRAWAGGAKCYGLGVRIVPNRGVDDGWTVRFTPDQDKPAELEIATYAD